MSLSPAPRDGGAQGMLSAWDGALHHSRPVSRTRQSPWPRLQGANHSHRAKGVGMTNKHVAYTCLPVLGCIEANFDLMKLLSLNSN